MPTIRFRDLPATTRAYIAVTVVVGSLTILQSAAQLYLHPIGWSWAVLALLTLLSGSATVHLPVAATVSVSETFVFTSVLLFGPAAGTLTVALDALIISLWSFRRGHPRYKTLFNVCAVSLTLWFSSHLYYALSSIGPLYNVRDRSVPISVLLLPLLVFTISYYAVNTWLISFAIALERRADAFRIWRDNFLWIAVNYFGGASVAALLVSYTHQLDYTFLVIIVPLLVVLYLTFSMSMGRVEDANRHLSELNALYMSTIETLAMAIDAKDQITHGHIRRVQSYAVGLARVMGVTDEPQIRAIEAAALLHDMGKLAVPEYILNKPGPLTPAEFEKMKMHAAVGADILSAIDFPYPVVPIVRHHHENWDGSGYPAGLSGTDIPIGARILSVVDCFDALTSDRPYRPRLPDRDALKILTDRRGTMYDPLVVDTFYRVHDQLAPPDLYSTGVSPLRAIARSSSPVEAIVPPARLEDIAASTDEMLTLFDLARSLSPSMSTADMVDVISKHIRRLVPCSLCVFYRYDVATDELVATHVSGEQSTLVTGLRIPRGQRLTGWVAANRQTIRNSDPVLDFGESARAMTPRPRSCLSTSLAAATELIGVLSLYSTNRDGFTADHERVLEIIARQAAPVLKHASEFDIHKHEHLKDRLTALPNLGQFVEFASSIGDTDSRAPASLLLVHIDNLNRITTEFGRRAGDIAVNHTAAEIRGCLRPSDMLFRHNDDQLLVVLPQTPAHAAKGIATKMSQEVARRQDDLGFELVVTIVVASTPTDADSFQKLLEIAKTRLVGGAADSPGGSGGVVH